MNEPTATDITHLRRLAKGRHDHVRGCKKTLDQCKECAGGIVWFGGLSLHTLSAVLEERKEG